MKVRYTVLSLVLAGLLSAVSAWADESAPANVPTGSPEVAVPVAPKVKEDRKAVHKNRKRVHADKKQLHKDIQEKGKESSEVSKDKEQLKEDRAALKSSKEQLKGDAVAPVGN